MEANFNFELLQSIALFHYYEQAIREMERLRDSQQRELEECHDEIARLRNQVRGFQNRHWELIQQVAQLQETIINLLQARETLE